MKFTELKSERLRFRTFDKSDAEVVFRWASNPENIKYTRFDGSKGIEESEAFIAECITLAEKDNCLDFEFAVVLKETGNVIGSVQIICRNEYEASLGYLFLPEYWNKGYGTESVKTLIAFGFSKLGLHRIIAECDAEHYGTYHVMQKAGMRREGHFRKNRRGNVVLNHEWRDELLYAILREDWDNITL
jgi:RimJ/RimL family protein N-acetyltransferase